MKGIQYVNLLGVLVLGALCVAQWQRDRRMNLEVNRLEKARIDHQSMLAEQEQLIQGLNMDLAQFKEEMAKVQTELNETRQKLRVAEREARQLTAERDQLKTSITNWVAAVNARDERLKEANKEIGRLAGELNGSIAKFNELATNYNATVKDLNELRARLAQSSQPSKQ
jgi:chromosome segregation ATPase